MNRWAITLLISVLISPACGSRVVVGREHANRSPQGGAAGSLAGSAGAGTSATGGTSTVDGIGGDEVETSAGNDGEEDDETETETGVGGDEL